MSRGESSQTRRSSDEISMSLLMSTQGNGENTKALQNFTETGQNSSGLYRTPTILCKDKEDAYTPRVVSIGPVHRGKEHVRAMESVKLSYMQLLFQRTERGIDETRKSCVDAVSEMLESPKNGYGGLGVDESATSMLEEMMVIDGCFIIELLYRNVLHEKDPILCCPGRYHDVVHDLVLLENQFPFKVLERLFDLTVKLVPNYDDSNHSLRSCVFSLPGNILGERKFDEIPDADQMPAYHILHLLQKYHIPCYKEAVTDEEWEAECGGEPPSKYYSAKQLKLAGVELKAHGTSGLLAMQFDTVGCCFCLRGQLKLTHFTVRGNTEALLRNLIAFEQCCPWVYPYFTSHAFLMSILMKTVEDVKLFREASIIDNFMGSDEEIPQLFSDICRNATPRSHDFFYNVRYNKVIDFCTPSRVSIGNFRNDYFRNPWAGISFLAALLIFVLTVISTLYVVLTYYYK